MPYMKVNLNGRKYVISGLTDHTSSRHILSSLARADSTFHLETTCTEFSDTSVENEARSKGTRIKRTRQTRVRRSSTSSVEIVEVKKNSLQGLLSDQKLLIDLESSEWSDGQGILKPDDCTNKNFLKNSKKSDKIRHAKGIDCHTTHKSNAKCVDSKSKNVQEKCNASIHKSHECNTTSESNAGCDLPKKAEVKRRRRKSCKRPVSQDVTGWKEKEEENKEKMDEIGRKGWKSADDVNDVEKPSSNKDEIKKHKHKRKHKTKHSHNKIDCRSSDQRLTIAPIDKPTEYRRVKRHVRNEVGDTRIQRMISRTIDQRFVDFHLACMKSYACAPPNYHSNEHEIRAKLLQLVESQQKCLSALKKAEKQNKKTMSRYTKYLTLDQEKIKFYGVEKSHKIERTRKMSDTDTGISEMHSDSSTEQTNEYTRDPNNDVISDDFLLDDVSKTSSPYPLDDIIHKDSGDTHQNSFPPQCDVIAQSSDVTSNKSQESSAPNYVITVDAVAIDDVTHDVQTYVYEKDDDTQSEIIIAQPTGVIPSETTSGLTPYRSAESINTSMLSDNSESSFHGDGHDVEELSRVLMQEQQKQRDMKRKLDRQREEINLMDSRIKEHEKMADILNELKHLNTDLVENENQNDEKDTQSEKLSLEKSIKLSVNLYEYQKGEIGKNSKNLDNIQSQVRRKRWHVESAVKELERAVSSSSRSQIDRIRSLERLPAGFAGLSIRKEVCEDGTLV